MKIGNDLAGNGQDQEQPASGAPHGQHEEIRLLTAMASAPTLHEQRKLAAALEALRMGRTAAIRAERDLDWGAAEEDSNPPPRPAQNRHTAASDWLGEEADPPEGEDAGQQMAAEASVWWNRLPDLVRQYPSELATQARGRARVAASRYGHQAPAAERAFLVQIDYLHLRTAGLRLFADGIYPNNQSQYPPASSLPVGVSNKDTAYGDGSWADGKTPAADPTSPGDAPSLGMGSQPEGDSSQGIANPAATTTHDAGPGTGNTEATDYLDGTATPPRGTQNDKVIASLMRMATRIDVINQIVQTHTPQKIDGMLVDPTTAAALQQAYATLPPEAQAKFESVPLPQLVALVDKHSQPDQGANQGKVPAAPPPPTGSPAAAPARPPGPPRAAQRRTADTIMPSSRSPYTPSVNEGDAPEGDHAEPWVDPAVTEHTHDAGPGNTEAVDYLGEGTYPWPTTGSLLVSAGDLPPWLQKGDDDDKGKADDSDEDDSGDEDDDDSDEGDDDSGERDSGDEDGDDDDNDKEGGAQFEKKSAKPRQESEMWDPSVPMESFRPGNRVHFVGDGSSKVPGTVDYVSPAVGTGGQHRIGWHDDEGNRYEHHEDLLRTARLSPNAKMAAFRSQVAANLRTGVRA